MKSLQGYWVACCIFVLCANALRAQEVPGGTEKEAPAPIGVEKFYWDLTKSEDRALKTMAERYVNLVKVQEWSDQSGKFKTVAHYVKHDPNITMVTIRIMKGRGAERTSEDKTVPVDKLSKTCQSRVKQIDTMQKKLKELAAKDPKNGTPGTSPEGPGAAVAGETGTGPAASGPAGAQGPGAAAAPEPDPSAAEPDPLGFGEIQFEQPAAVPGTGP